MRWYWNRKAEFRCSVHNLWFSQRKTSGNFIRLTQKLAAMPISFFFCGVGALLARPQTQFYLATCFRDLHNSVYNDDAFKETFKFVLNIFHSFFLLFFFFVINVSWNICSWYLCVISGEILFFIYKRRTTVFQPRKINIRTSVEGNPYISLLVLIFVLWRCRICPVSYPPNKRPSRYAYRI